MEAIVQEKNQKIYEIEEIKNLLLNYFESKPVNKAYLFGSYARSEANIHSDVDILLELNYSKGISMVFAFMKSEMEEILKKKVDIITTNSISKYIRNNLENEKILLYEKYT